MSIDSKSADAKRQAIFEAAADLFARYGLRRTSMNDIAQASAMSRASLYLLFDNKEDLFRQLAIARQDEAIGQAKAELSKSSPLSERMVRAILAYERLYYEPVAQSPHGGELMDANLSIASEPMKQGSARLVGHLADALEEAVSTGDARLDQVAMTAREFVELLMPAINGQKKLATSNTDFRRRVRQVALIFLNSITPGETK